MRAREIEEGAANVLRRLKWLVKLLARNDDVVGAIRIKAEHEGRQEYRLEKREVKG